MSWTGEGCPACVRGMVLWLSSLPFAEVLICSRSLLLFDFYRLRYHICYLAETEAYELFILQDRYFNVVTTVQYQIENRGKSGLRAAEVALLFAGLGRKRNSE
jgi:hypothetical protein